MKFHHAALVDTLAFWRRGAADPVSPPPVPARYDALTGLYARAAFLDLLDAEPASVIVLDLDGLRLVQRLHGRAAAERVLATTAARLRRVAEPAGVLGRLADDELGCVLHHPAGSTLPQEIASAMLAALAEPIEVRGGVVTLHAAIGIAGALDAARAAASQGKRAGAASCVVAAAGEGALDLQGGLARGEFVPLYRPLVEPRSGVTLGFECCASWNHPQRGGLLAEAFLDQAQACGLRHALGLTILRRACADADRWPRRQTLSFDASALTLDDPALAQSVLRILLASGLAPRRLTLRLPRGAAIADRATARASLLALSNAGVQVELDGIDLAPGGARRRAANDPAPLVAVRQA